MQAQSIQSKGGAARAESLSGDERADIARKASEARWTKLPTTEFDGEIPLGTGSINCSVLEKDGKIIRIISSTGFMAALGRPYKGTYKRTELPSFLDANNLKPFLSQELLSVLSVYEYRTANGSIRRGFPAEAVPMVCEVYLSARDEGVLLASQLKVAKACDLIMRGLARVGIAALVDEATGYQYSRERSALAKILEAYIAKELQPWTRTFPLEFYQQIFRLNGWKFDPATMQGPRCLAQYTDNVVYKRLAPGVLKTLREKNPIVEGKGKRKHRHFQWLTGEIGHPKLMAHLEGVKILMRESDGWDQFMSRLEKHYPIFETTELGFPVQVKKKDKRVADSKRITEIASHLS
jgi:hypothetical protein